MSSTPISTESVVVVPEVSNSLVSKENHIYPWKLNRKSATSSIFLKISMREHANLKKVCGFIDADMGISYIGHPRYDNISITYATEGDQMRAYKAKYNRKRDHFDVGYHLPAHKWGRIMPANNLSLCIMHRPTRHALCKGIYVDIDMVNCHPSILSQICKQHKHPCPKLDKYVSEAKVYRANIEKYHGCTKDTAKRLPISLMMGGTYGGWIEDNDITKNKNKYLAEIVELQTELEGIKQIINKENKEIKEIVTDLKPKKWPNMRKAERGVMGLWCQTIEREIQESAILWLKEHKKLKLQDIVPCQDGFMVLKSQFYPELVADVEKNTMDVLGFEIKWAVKEFDEADENIPDGNTSEGTGSGDGDVLFAGDDAMAARIVRKHYPHWVYCEKILYAYDKASGMWSSDASVHRGIIMSLAEHLTVYKELKNGSTEATRMNYGSNLTLCDKIPHMLKGIQEISDDDWLRNGERSSLGYLLFNNGYLNMREGTFYSKAEFDPSIVFFNKISKDYVEATDRADVDYIRSIRQRLFYNSLGKETGDYYILTLARALAGDTMKRCLFGLGASNTGKGVLTNALTYSCGSYIGTFNAESLAYKPNSSQDEGQKLRWAFLLRSKRIIMSNEVTNNSMLDGGLFKKLTGGEGCCGRTHGGEETEFLPNFMMLLLANDVPRFNEQSDAIDNRIRCVQYEKSFVVKPQSECGAFEMPADNGIKAEICTPEFQRCFLQLLINEYVQFSTEDDGIERPEPESVKMAKQNWFDLVKPGGVAADFVTAFKMTGDGTKDYVLGSAVDAWLKKASPGTTIKKLSVELNKYCVAKGLPVVASKQKKIGGKVVQCWMGVREYREGEDCDCDDPDVEVLTPVGPASECLFDADDEPEVSIPVYKLNATR